MEDNRRETVCAVVVTYNRKKLLRECLDALLFQTRPLDSIIIIDNASSDGTEEFLKRNYLHNPILQYVRFSQNTGGAGGFHEGVKRGYEKGFDWLWLMDDDVIPVKSGLAELVKAIDRYPNAVCFVPKRVYEDGTEIVGHEQTVDSRWYSVRSFRTPQSLVDVPISKYTFEGPLVSSHAVQRIGLPDPKYFILYDDVDYAYRLSQVGSCYYVSSSVMVKMIRIPSDLFVPGNEWKQYYRWRNYVFFMKKSLGIRATIKVIYRLSFDSLAIVKKAIRKRSPRPLHYFRVLSRAFFDGVTGTMRNRWYSWMK